MPKSKFVDDMEVRNFPSLDLPKGATSPGKLGEGTRVAKRMGTESLNTQVNKDFPAGTGNLKESTGPSMGGAFGGVTSKRR